ncbi:MAG: hypothetical protein H0X42_07035 [Solirubrobacterales bacterium]|nr:hypothetical protein [Solirubrobacterales bacterium]
MERAAANPAGHFEHVILVDPPTSARAAELVAAAREDWDEPGAGEGAPGFLHPSWTEAELPFSLQALAERFPTRNGVGRIYRALREAGEASGVELREALAGGGAHPLAPETAARSFRVLRELDLVSGEPNRGDGAVGVVSSEGTDLERSAAFRAYSDELSETQQYLERRKQP